MSEIKNKKPAIEVRGLVKSFRIPHERNSSLKSAFINLFRPKKGYSDLVAINDISFEVKRGEFLGIIGKNGSGKSTLLKMLAGIYSSDSGRVIIDGKLSPFLELGVGFNPELTGRENLFLGGALLGLSRKEITAKYNDIVKFAELEEFIDLKLKNYSSGMQVRLAFALSIHVNADILLMDEVLAVGDSNFQQKCISEFEKYKKEGKTVVLVTHDLNAIRDHCDRAILMSGGKISKIGTPEKVVEQYMFEGAEQASSAIINERKSMPIKQSTDHPVIKDVYFLDNKNNRRDVFHFGEEFILRICLDRYKTLKTDEINYAFGLYSNGNDYVFGANTIRDNVVPKKFSKRGFVDIVFTAPNINSGKYYFKISIAGNGFSQGSIYSFLSRSRDLTIISDTYHEGLIKLNYHWS